MHLCACACVFDACACVSVPVCMAYGLAWHLNLKVKSWSTSHEHCRRMRHGMRHGIMGIRCAHTHKSRHTHTHIHTHTIPQTPPSQVCNDCSARARCYPQPRSSIRDINRSRMLRKCTAHMIECASGFVYKYLNTSKLKTHCQTQYRG